MENKQVEVYSDLVDNSVLRMPGRRMLGSLIQGDTLFLLHADLMDILESHKHEPETELFYQIFQIAQSIENRLCHFTDICKNHNINLNFEMEFSVEDYRDLL